MKVGFSAVRKPLSVLLGGLHLADDRGHLAAAGLADAVVLEGARQAGHLLQLEPLDLVLELHVHLPHLPHLLVHPGKHILCSKLRAGHTRQLSRRCIDVK